MSFKESLARHAYSWLWRCISPLYVIKLFIRGKKEPFYRQNILYRFGFYGSKAAAPYAGQYIWLHAVSLGETRASIVFIDALRKNMPHMKLLLTHGTATGWMQGQGLLHEGDMQCWLPIDTPGAVMRFIKHFRPQLGLIMETEMWPNLMHITKKQQLPMYLVNARLSEKSMNGALKVKALLRPAYEALSTALAQSEADAQRLKQLGVPEVEVLGNIKYDMQPSPELLHKGGDWKSKISRKVIMASSTREGEEALLLDAWKQAPWKDWQQKEKPILLIVPRHPQRFTEVSTLVETSGLSYCKRSAWNENGLEDVDIKADVWLGDSLQEMPFYYGLSDMVLLGGSFKKFGAQNLIEALACGKPVIFGLYTYNFAQASQAALDAGVGVRVDSFRDALEQSASWLEDLPLLKKLQQQSIEFIQAHQGAAKRMADYMTLAVNNINTK